MTIGASGGADDGAAQPAPESVLGHAEFAERAAALLRGARHEVVILSHDLDRRIYGSDVFVNALRAFLLQHRRGRLRGLVLAPQNVMRGPHRLVELTRALTSRMEFRQPASALPGSEEYLIVDGRGLLHRPAPEELEAHYYPNAPLLGRERLQDFEQVWTGATPAREFSDLRL